MLLFTEFFFDWVVVYSSKVELSGRRGKKAALMNIWSRLRAIQDVVRKKTPEKEVVVPLYVNPLLAFFFSLTLLLYNCQEKSNFFFHSLCCASDNKRRLRSEFVCCMSIYMTLRIENTKAYSKPFVMDIWPSRQPPWKPYKVAWFINGKSSSLYVFGPLINKWSHLKACRWHNAILISLRGRDLLHQSCIDNQAGF